MGEIAFLDRPGGGTHVRIAFDSDRLAGLATAGAQAGADDDDDNGNGNGNDEDAA